MAEAAIYTERVDDVPVLVRLQEQMGIPAVLDEVIPVHGNRRGLSPGWLACLWLSFILSEGDHRMVRVERWAADRIETLARLSPQPVTIKDFTDDRLADLLGVLGEDDLWERIEQRLGERLIRVYSLPLETVRVDSTTAAVYHDREGSTLFRQGHSKDRRPDLAQFKVMLAALDPSGLPLATLVVPGNTSDDPLYEPAIAQARQVVGQGGRLYVGDSKMAALRTRAFLEEGGDFYLVPLALAQASAAWRRQLLEPVWAKEQPLERIERLVEGEEKPKLQALAYETTRLQQLRRPDGETFTWLERVLVIFSLSLVRQQRRGLEQRLRRAEEKLRALTPPPGRGRRPYREREPLEQRVQAILKKYQVEGLLEVTYHREVRRRHVRGYGGRPARIEEDVRYRVEVHRNAEAIRAARRQMGWRLYATNAPAERLPLAEAVRIYRGSALIERNFRRLKGRPLGVCPLYVRREDHARGMVRLLSLALRVLTLVEHTVREKIRHVSLRSYAVWCRANIASCACMSEPPSVEPLTC